MRSGESGGPSSGGDRTVIINADGGSRGNPGPAGYGAVVFGPDGVTVLAERAAALGITTNNVAEYTGLIAGLEAARELGATRVTARMDSKLVVEQMSGRWKVKHPAMRPLKDRAAALVGDFDQVDFEWVPRAENSHADRLANEAMDAAAAGRAWTPPELVPGPTPPADTAQPPADAEQPPADAEAPPADVQPPADPVTDDGAELDTTPTWQDPAAALPHPRDGEPTRFVVVRHGETTWGAEARFAGREDVSLTLRGRRQASAVAARIARLAPAVVLTSPLQRCRNTAQAIAAEVGAPVQVDERLIDGLLGDWTGFRAMEIEEQWPREFAAWRSDPDAKPPGGESFTEIRQRVRPLMTDALTTYRGHTVVLVTHAAPSKMILATALDVDSAVAYRVRVDTASLSGFTVEADGAVMVWAINETGHLIG
ncbi:MAG: bifunctional RNase H/acid phosphatase [Nakamurella sp.]